MSMDYWSAEYKERLLEEMRETEESVGIALQQLGLALKVLRHAKKCFGVPHNLLLATDEECREVVRRFIEWWNTEAAPMLGDEEAE